jgi:CBS domain-containing protein
MNAMIYATKDVVTIAPSASIDRAISLMEERGIHHLVVVENDRVVGMLSDRDILISTGWMLSVERRTASGAMRRGEVIGPTVVEQIMSRPVVCLMREQNAREAAILMVGHRISALPVLQAGRLVAIVSDVDLMKWLMELAAGDNAVGRFLRRPVVDLMRAQVTTVTPENLLVEVTDIFRRRRVRHVPVVDDGLVVGIISDRDVRRSLGWSSVREAQAEQENQGSEIRSPCTAADIMQRQVLWTQRSATLHDALRILVDKHIHSLPVIEKGRLTGIITQTDFIRAVAREDLL